MPGRYKNTAGLLPERTEFCSGKLTAYIGTQSHPTSLFRGILDFALGRQEQNPELELVTASRLSLRAARRRSCRMMMDGEILWLSFPIEFSVLPGHLRVLASPGLICPAEP